MLEYESNRGIMWTFTSPLILKMYCNANDISLWDINAHYHIIFIILYTFIIPFKTQPFFIFLIILFFIPSILFLKSLYKYRQLPFTNLYILIWIIFIFIKILDMTNLVEPIVIHSLYNIADTLCKFICKIVISDYNEQEIIVRENIDLQSIQFTSHVIKSIKEFENNNIKLTPYCNNLILYCKKKFIDKIPKSNEKLKLELLKKILPLDLDKDYLSINNCNSSNKGFTFICVMFMDIINYTELANKYKSGDVIFKLLDDIYYHFDNIIKKYPHIQKIETIGDAYMVIGDIYRQKLNHKIVIKEIILLGLDFIREIKTIKTPDNVPLCIRIGINIGDVNIGILGNENPRLCVVGNTVNIAARLQSTAEEDTIQMSKHIYEQLEEIDFGIEIKCVEKKNVFLKNIGTIIKHNIKPAKWCI
jgi:class 3 adenylate cyclase